MDLVCGIVIAIGITRKGEDKMNKFMRASIVSLLTGIGLSIVAILNQLQGWNNNARGMIALFIIGGFILGVIGVGVD